MSAGDKYAAGYPVKLVRDDVGVRLGGRGTVTYDRVGDRAEHARQLRKKLVEEAVEYLADPSVEELADVLACVRDLARVDLDVTYDAVLIVEHKKRAERGGFASGTLMVAHHPADGRDLLAREEA